MKYTLDTDFSTLNGPKAANWIRDFSGIVEKAFADSSDHARLLGNLLILEMYAHTLRQGLAGIGRTIPVILQDALDLLWAYLEGHKEPSDFQDFANNFYASTLNYNVGEEISEAQEEFYKANFKDVGRTTCEWQMLTWLSVLIMELTAVTGGRLDFEEYREYEPEIDFAEMQVMIELLGDACIEFTGTPLPSNKVKDVINALEQVYQTPLFRQFIERIQNGLKTVLSAAPEQYPALREEYCQYVLLPEEYASSLLKF